MRESFPRLVGRIVPSRATRKIAPIALRGSKKVRAHVSGPEINEDDGRIRTPACNFETV